MSAGAPPMPLLPNSDQVDPSHRIGESAYRWPATGSPLGSTARERTLSLRPAPRGDHDVPSQRAMLCAATPPAGVKVPPASRSPFGSPTSESTYEVEWGAPMPAPKGDH